MLWRWGARVVAQTSSGCGSRRSLRAGNLRQRPLTRGNPRQRGVKVIAAGRGHAIALNWGWWQRGSQNAGSASRRMRQLARGRRTHQHGPISAAAVSRRPIAHRKRIGVGGCARSGRVRKFYLPNIIPVSRLLGRTVSVVAALTTGFAAR